MPDVQDPEGTAYGMFRVLAVRHEVGDGNDTNHFTALPEAANPHVQPTQGVAELAQVIDVADPQQLGRIRVRYYWPVETPADAETGWVRVSTPYSGDGKGQLFTPEPHSQVLVGYEQGQAEFPVVLGNLFHPQNAQKAKYSTPHNHLKGLQTAGGNKVVMSDTKDAQTILLSNSNKKTTAITVSFENDGKVHIMSAGPVVVNGSSIRLEAGAPAKGGGPYTGEIVMKAKTITMEAQDDMKATSKTKNITLAAKDTIKIAGKEKTEITGTSVDVTATIATNIKGQVVKINS